MIVDRAALSRLPAQDKAFKIFTFIYKVAGVALVCEVEVGVDLPLFRPQIGNKPSQVRQLHLPGFVFKLVNGCL